MVETLLGVQIFALCFAAFMLYVAFIHYKKNNLTKLEFKFWLVTWVVFCFFVFFPRILNPILKDLFIARAMDLFMIIAFMILTVLGFFNHLSVKKLERQLEELVRLQANRHVKKS